MTLLESPSATRAKRPAPTGTRLPILSTTPGRFRALSIVLIVAALTFGLVSWAAAYSRRAATRAAAHQSELLLVQAEQLYVSLADADATAATTFVTGGVEPASRRARYLSELKAATERLTTLSAEVGDSPSAERAVRTLAEDIPVYSGLIDAARANDLQGLPLGVGYLRQASMVMRTQLLAAARKLYEVEATRLGDDYRSGTWPVSLWVPVAAGILTLALFLGGQWYLLRRTNRIFNVPLVVGSVAILLVLVWSALAIGLQQSDLADAARTGSDGVQVLSAARILALRDQGDESLALVSRGSGSDYLTDFNVVAARLGGANGDGGLIGADRIIADRSNTGGGVDSLARAFSFYLATHAAVVRLQDAGLFVCADRYAVQTVARAPGCPPSSDSETEVAAAAALDARLDDGIDASQARFRAASARAIAALDGLALGIPLLAIAAAVAGLIGFQRRIDEYR